MTATAAGLAGVSPIATRLALCTYAALVSGCAARGVAGGTADAGMPRVSWEIRTGALEGDERFVCGTTKPAPCVIPARADRRASRTSVAVFVHPTKQPVSYLGLVRASFIQGSGKHIGEVNITVPPDASPVGSSILGIVTQQPSDYVLKIALDTTSDGRAPARIAEDIPVTVR